MKVGTHVYIYEVEGYRDSNGNPRNKKHPVGKVDPQTGEEIFKTEFLPKLPAYGRKIPLQPKKTSFTARDIKTSTVRDYGAAFFLDRIAEQTGLKEVLGASLGRFQKELLVLAEYLILSENPFAYIAHWIEETETEGGRTLSSPRVSDLLHEISAAEREGFFTAWAEYRREREYLALDITSLSSWSDLIEDVEWGYNREGDRLEQINLCLLMGEVSFLPVFETVYQGSLKDVSTLKTTLRQAACYTAGETLLLVLDKGFYSAKNVNLLLESREKYGFVISVPFTCGFAKEWVRKERKDIDVPENTLRVNKGSVRTVSRRMEWPGGKTLKVHLCFNALKAAMRKEELYAHVSLLRERAEKDPGNARYKQEIEKYLAPVKRGKGVSWKIRHEVLEKELESSGWLVLITNRVRSAEQALEYYRAKDVVEKGFFRLKSAIDMRRIRVHSQESMQNKLFVGFIALILMSHINKVMTQKSLYRDMTMKDLLYTLKKLRLQRIGDENILFPVTREQKAIYDAFSIKPPALS
jgi:hypothetical protein